MTRIVIENASDTGRQATAALFRDAGYDVAVCGGPTAFEEGCPLVSSGGCPLFDGADVAFFDLDLDEVGNRRVLRHVRVLHPEVPVVLEIPAASARRYRGLLEGCEVVLPFDADKLLAGVERAVERVTASSRG